MCKMAHTVLVCRPIVRFPDTAITHRCRFRTRTDAHPRGASDLPRDLPAVLLGLRTAGDPDQSGGRQFPVRGLPARVERTGRPAAVASLVATGSALSRPALASHLAPVAGSFSGRPGI